MKKIISVTIALLMVVGTVLIAPGASAAGVTIDQLVAAAAGIIQKNEGAYNSVNADDNGALSVGWIQWHGNRALNLLKSIVNANRTNAQSILGTTLYNEILNSTDWSTRTVNADERQKLIRLLDTPEGHTEQDKLARSDIRIYINHGMELGITDPAALIYFADIENQCGGGGSKRVAEAAKNSLGSYGAITLDAIHNAALSDSVAGRKEFVSRRKNTYNNAYDTCVIMGWTAISEKYEIWSASTSLNIRSGPGTSNPAVASLGSGAKTVIFDKVMVGDALWGRNSTGWISLDYCTYSSGSVPTPVIFDPTGAAFSHARYTAAVDNTNAVRNSSQLIIYTSEFGSNTKTNEWGAEAIVGSDGRVTKAAVHGSCNSAIPAGGFVISGHDGSQGARASEICLNIKEGNYVYFDRSTMTLSVFDDKNDYLLASKKPSVGDTMGEMPVVSKPYLVFDGWYTAPTGGEKVTSETKFNSHTALFLYAHWVAEAPVTYITNGGTIANITTRDIDAVNTNRGADQLVLYNSSYQSSTTNTNIYGGDVAVDADGKVLNAPEYGKNNITIPDGGFVISGHNSAYNWLESNVSIDSYISFDMGSKAITVYKDKNTYDAVNKQLSKDSALGALPELSRDGCYRFTGWTDEDGNAVTEDTIVPLGGLTVYAQWQQHPDVTETVTALPTCDDDGSKTVVCNICGETVSEEIIPALGHDWIAESTTEATCVDEGYTDYVCSRDPSHTKRDDIVPATDEHISAEAEITEPTCTEDGLRITKCTVCGKTISEEIISATGHDWIAESTTEATCVDGGYTDYVCSRDPSHTKRDDIVPATDEHISAEAEITEPTCTEDGLRITKCTVCGKTISEEIISATGHSWTVSETVEPSCVDGGYTEYVCENDPSHTKQDDITPANSVHIPGDAVIETPAACTEEGLLVTHCAVCGEIISTEPLPATGHKWVEKKAADGCIVFVCEHDSEHIMIFTFENENTILGDVDNNGYVDTKDVIYLLGYLTDYEGYPVDLTAQSFCDFNGDGKTDRDDAVYLLYNILMPEKYPLLCEATKE